MVDGFASWPRDWKYEAVSIGFPGLVGKHGPRSEPGNLGTGWVGFDSPPLSKSRSAYERCRHARRSAATRAAECCSSASALAWLPHVIAGFVIVPLELGHLPFDSSRRLSDVLGRKGLKRLGKVEWRKAVAQ